MTDTHTGMDWAAALNTVLNVVLPLLVTLLFPWVRRLLLQAVERGKHAELASIAAQAVMAAEQMYQSEAGVVRLNYAITAVSTYAARRGIPVDEEIIRLFIEAAVSNMNRQQPAKPILR